MTNPLTLQITNTTELNNAQLVMRAIRECLNGNEQTREIGTVFVDYQGNLHATLDLFGQGASLTLHTDIALQVANEAAEDCGHYTVSQWWAGGWVIV